MLKTLKRINKKECVLFIVLFLLISFAYLAIAPNIAFAINPTDTVYNAQWPSGFEIFSVFQYLPGLLIGQPCLNLAINCAGLANEFYATITGSNLFNAEITGSSFSSVMSLVTKICKGLQPIGYTILGIFVGIEALRICKDTKGLSSQWLGLGIMETWLVFAIKFTILYTLITHAKDLMLAIYDLVCNIQTAIKTAVGDGLGNSTTTFDSITTMAQSITFNDDVSIALLLMLVAFVCLISAAITAIYVQVLAVMRVFEIFILIAVSPASVACLSSSYTSSIAAGYFKTFVGAVLQISILFLIITLAGPILSTVTSSINDVFIVNAENTTIVQKLMGAITPIVTSLALFFMAKQSRPIADRLAGAA